MLARDISDRRYLESRSLLLVLLRTMCAGGSKHKGWRQVQHAATVFTIFVASTIRQCSALLRCCPVVFADHCTSSFSVGQSIASRVAPAAPYPAFSSPFFKIPANWNVLECRESGDYADMP
eukprot:TRINITY_DN45048_c0_g1_i1.p4 TRINITY_DN45048_c0_g1~~TRINITY_DN45048_c0_g1_i1.p4  ORF type:complete len:121 (-),score=2.03 TRINITY_DN45048_c0_g1_i1:62-424(-)